MIILRLEIMTGNNRSRMCMATTELPDKGPSLEVVFVFFMSLYLVQNVYSHLQL